MLHMQRDIKVQLQQGHGLLRRGEKVMQRACPYLDIGLKAKKLGHKRETLKEGWRNSWLDREGKMRVESPGKALCQMSFRSHTWWDWIRIIDVISGHEKNYFIGMIGWIERKDTKSRGYKHASLKRLTKHCMIPTTWQPIKGKLKN